MTGKGGASQRAAWAGARSSAVIAYRSAYTFEQEIIQCVHLFHIIQKAQGFVERVAKNLRPGHFELDALTFDKCDLNAREIS